MPSFRYASNRRPRRPRLILALLLASSAVPVAALAETLADAVLQSYQTNPGIQSQRAQLRALNETYVQARAGFGLRAQADVSLAYEDFENDHNLGSKGSSSSESVSLSQPLFTGGRVSAAVQAAEADIRAGRERLRQAEIDLLQRVVAAYVAVRRDQQIAIVARSTADALRQQLEETQAKTEVRENTRTDLAQAQARLAASQAQIASVDAQLAFSRAQYLNVVGQNPGDLAPEPDLAGVPPSIDQAFDVAESKNPTLLAAKYAEQASRARLSAAKSQNLPNINLRLARSRQPQTQYSPSPYSDSLTAQAVISQPLFTSGLNSSQIRRAAELNTADRLTIDSTRRNIVQGVSQQWSQLAAARQSLVADQANVTASETAFYGMRQEERLGLRSTIEVLNTQQELTAAQISLLRDRYNEYVSRVGVLNAMGVLGPEALVPGGVPYDPVPDFDRVKNRGALPTEYIVRALDGVATPSLGPPMPARETATPDHQAVLPPSPPPAASQSPLRSVTELMTDVPIETAPGR
jgi:outer membrane protein/S-layer protein transport system outer membrane protein